MANPHTTTSGANPGVVVETLDPSGNEQIAGNLAVTGSITGQGLRDATGKPSPFPGTVAMTAGAVGTTVAGTISGTTNAGQSPTVTAVSGDDSRCVATLNPVTGGGAQSAGEVAQVRFSTPYPAVPKLVQLQVVDITTATTPAAVASYATNITAAGFGVTTPALTTAHNYLITFEVVP